MKNKYIKTKYSSCCGVLMNNHYADILICPECKEHCGVEIKEEEGLNPIISSEELRNGRNDDEQDCFEQNTESLWD